MLKDVKQGVISWDIDCGRINYVSYANCVNLLWCCKVKLLSLMKVYKLIMVTDLCLDASILWAS